MLAFVLWSLFSLSVIEDEAKSPPPVPLIYDTDMGNDVDDGFALGVIHALQSRGECELLAVTVTKDHELAGPFVDVLNTFYGRREIPIGVVRDGATPKQGKFLGLAAEKVDGGYQYPHDLESSEDTLDPTALLRKTLAGQADSSVVIVQVGFSTNMARLLDSGPDEYSSLNGRELVAKKVKALSAMAGAFEPFRGNPHREYNVVMDIPSAQKLAREWPVDIVYSGFEIGIKTALDQRSMKYDYDYVLDHPMRAAYHLYNEAYRDQPSWDLTSVLWAVRPDRGYFDLSHRGRVTYDDEGYTSWEDDPDGNHRHLIVDEAQIERVKEILAALASEPPH